ncbi:MAG: prepilin peptidase, partial [Proteobacteria bacterium]|nr:prepilin peptidase [Pseudomonadota bacterium]
LVGAIVDLKCYIIPDEVSIYAVPVGIVGAVAMEYLGYEGWLALGWRQSVVGALVVALFLAFVSLVFRALRRREGLGWGDVKLMMMIGAFLGLMPGAWFVLIVGSIGGSVFGICHMLIKRRRMALPFGPALALAAIVYIYYGDILIRRYLPALEAWLPLS